uniref:Uncharacterized protein n=1 Tax=Steinernema glaseri TaxID=37863 RepID=A0A1I7YGI4_9BILA
MASLEIIFFSDCLGHHSHRNLIERLLQPLVKGEPKEKDSKSGYHADEVHIAGARNTQDPIWAIGSKHLSPGIFNDVTKGSLCKFHFVAMMWT